MIIKQTTLPGSKPMHYPLNHTGYPRNHRISGLQIDKTECGWSVRDDRADWECSNSFNTQKAYLCQTCPYSTVYDPGMALSISPTSCQIPKSQRSLGRDCGVGQLESSPIKYFQLFFLRNLSENHQFEDTQKACILAINIIAHLIRIITFRCGSLDH